MKLIYKFEQGTAEGNKSQAALLGGKGANLAEMCSLNLPIPAGLTIPTDACVDYMNGSSTAQETLINVIAASVETELTDMFKSEKFDPLFSVRSGSRVSMPGMMDTILNVGITTENLADYRKHLGDRVALDSFRRLIQMFGNVVHGIPNELFEHELDKAKSKKYGLSSPPKNDAELTVKHLEKVCDDYLALYESLIGSFPNSLNAQLQDCIEAVFKSWNSPRAVKYRAVNKIPNDWGTAVNVQRMVFGNKNDKSGSGVLFSRNPTTGEPGLYGEYLVNAQGEDVVAGIRTPEKLETMSAQNGSWSQMHSELVLFAQGMEDHYNDMQDMEFTVEDGTLYILQTRSGKRSAAASFRIAHDMVEEGKLTKEEAIARVNGKQYLVLNKPQIDNTFKVSPDFTGLPAAGNIATGTAVLSSAAAEKFKGDCILVTNETTPEDFGGMVASKGILTATGGATSHAAVVARGMDKTCVVGCTDLIVGKTVKEGDQVTIDGSTGRVWINKDVPVVKMKIDQHVRTIIGWAMTGSTKHMVKVTPEVSADKYDNFVEELAGQIPTDGKVYVDCSKLGGKYARYILRNLLEVLKSRTELTGIIGLANESMGNEDAKFLSFLGLSGDEVTTDEVVTFKAQMKALDLKKWTFKMKKNWTIHLPTAADSDAIAKLTSLKWKLVRPIKTLGDLMEVDGMLDVDDATAERLENEGVDLEKFVALLKDAGRTVEKMPKAVSRERMVFEVLGK